MITVLTGDNSYGINQQLRLLVSEFDGQAERYDGSDLTLGQLPDLFMGLTLFAPQRLIILKDISANKVVWGELSEWLDKLGEGTDVILVEPNADKRTKTFKWLQKNATLRRAEPLSLAEAVVWAQAETRRQGSEIDKNVADYLVDYVGVDQWLLQGGVNKLVLSGRPISLELIREIVEPTPQASAFELLDAVFMGETEKIERLISQLERSEDPYRFFGLVANQLFAVIAVGAGAGKTPEVIASAVGIHPYVIRKSLPLARRLTRRAQHALVERLADLDYNLKSRNVEPWLQIRTTLGMMQVDIK